MAVAVLAASPPPAAATFSAVSQGSRSMRLAAGPLAVGKVAGWQVRHQLPIESDAQGQVTVSRLIGGVDLECKEVVFSIDTPADQAGAPPAREFYVTTVCRDGEHWRWASAEPATARWGSLQ